MKTVPLFEANYVKIHVFFWTRDFADLWMTSWFYGLHRFFPVDSKNSFVIIDQRLTMKILEYQGKSVVAAIFFQIYNRQIRQELKSIKSTRSPLYKPGRKLLRCGCACHNSRSGHIGRAEKSVLLDLFEETACGGFDVFELSCVAVEFGMERFQPHTPLQAKVSHMVFNEMKFQGIFPGNVFSVQIHEQFDSCFKVFSWTHNLHARDDIADGFERSDNLACGR